MLGQDVCILIAGPCAAESREQVLAAAHGLQDVIFRAGVWKPRTRPESFAGAGEEGLKWLREVKETMGLRVATEVATPEQARVAMEARIDYLWIGARTSANPIAVQAIADEISRFQVAGFRLKGIWVKNPVNEDVELWLGNIRRMQQTGVEVGAIHRGCGHRPCWAMAHRLRAVMPEVKLLLDPSHMSGDSEQIAPLAMKAMNLGLDGLMVEVHPNPEKALSDSRQQITPERWNMIRREMKDYTPSNDTELQWLRAEMDETDDRLWEVLASRMEISGRIGDYKAERGLAVVQPERYEAIVRRRLEWAKTNGIPEDTVRAIMDAIHRESCRRQER